MEASSHGLDQYRLDGVKIAAAGFTGFGRDHLDYHATSEAYLAAKSRLFSDVLPLGGVAVLNADIPEFAHLASLAREHRASGLFLRNGRTRDPDRRTAVSSPAGQRVAQRSRFSGGDYEIEIPLVGGFQIMNALCALGMVSGADKVR